MENEDLKYIKKFYGEKFAHYCRSNFPTILEIPGVLKKIMSNTFAPTKFLNEIIDDDANESVFSTYIRSQFLKNHKIKANSSNLSPEELLDKAGYILYPECKTEKDIQYFKKYYKELEALCTFNGGRLNTCRVWFAVKKNADSLIRENFTIPKRQDEYGTSVISIQFTKEGNFLSIKNRYNHTVDNPDATFSNCLDNIVMGLTDAFEKKYGLKPANLIFEDLSINSKYTLASNGKYYHVNFKTTNYAFCENNCVMDLRTGNVNEYDTNSMIIMDKYIVDLQKKSILSQTEDSFTETFKSGIRNVSVVKNEDKTRTINFVLNDENVIKIKLNNQNNIEEYYNKDIKYISNGFMFDNTSLKKLELPEVEEIDDGFLVTNNNLKSLELPKVKIIKNEFLFDNKDLEKASLPNLLYVGNNFLFSNRTLKELNVPKLETMKHNCLRLNVAMTSLNFQNLKTIGDNFMIYNNEAKQINAPLLESVGNDFLMNNNLIKEISLPQLKHIGNSFFKENLKITTINMPLVENIGNDFLYRDMVVETLNMPSLKTVGNCFLNGNFDLSKIDFPSLETVGYSFLASNFRIRQVNFPKLQSVGKNFLLNNIASLHEINLPNLKTAGDNFMENNQGLEKIDAPKLESVGKNFLCYNKKLNQVKLPKLEKVGEDFLHDFMYAEKIKVLIHKKIELPNLKIVGESFFEDAPKRVCKQVRKNHKKSLEKDTQQGAVNNNAKENLTEENKTEKLDSNKVEELSSNKTEELTSTKNKENITNNNVVILDEDEEELVLKK